MDLDIIILSEVWLERQRQIPYDITYMWNLKYDTNESIYQTEIDSYPNSTVDQGSSHCKHYSKLLLAFPNLYFGPQSSLLKVALNVVPSSSL